MTVAYKFPADPPKEALDYLRAKNLRPSFDHRDVWRDEHATQFTVAKATTVDVLQSVRDEVDRALAEGRTFAQFQKDLQPRLADIGWWGSKEMVDPLTGEPRLVRLGSPRRLKTIYSTNMRTARAAGQWERIERTKSSHPFLLYELGPSENHRADHVRWAGLLLPIQDKFWSTHYPPNGWGCKCRVRQVSQAEYSRLSGTGNYNLQAPSVEAREWINNRTGEVLQVSKGIDPGWDYNAGAASRQARVLDMFGDKTQAADATISRQALTDIARSPGFAAWYEQPVGNFPLARISDADAKLLGAKRTLVNMSADTAAKQVVAHKDIKPADYSYVQSVVDDGVRIQEDGLNLIYILEAVGFVAVVKATRTGKALFLTSFRRLPSTDAKRDVEIRRLLKKGGND